MRVSDADIERAVRGLGGDLSPGDLAADLLDARREIEGLHERTRRYELLRQAINEDDSPCDPECDSYGHTETCKFVSTTACLENRQEEINRLRAERDALLKKVERVRALKREKSTITFGHGDVEAVGYVRTDDLDAALAGKEDV